MHLSNLAIDISRLFLERRMSQLVIDVIVTREIVGREQRGFCDASTPKITGQPEIALNCHVCDPTVCVYLL